MAKADLFTVKVFCKRMMLKNYTLMYKIHNQTVLYLLKSSGPSIPISLQKHYHLQPAGCPKGFFDKEPANYNILLCCIAPLKIS